MENVLFFPIWISPLHFETDLELMKTEITKGNNVFWLFCESDLRICDNNIFANKKKCNKCIKIRKQCLEIFFNNEINIIKLNKYTKEHNNFLINFKKPEIYNDINDLKKLIYQTFDIGYGIASSLAYELDKTPVSNLNQEISKFYTEAIFLYKTILSLIEEYSITKGYVFNGRFCFSKAFFQAFFDKGITIYTHDRGSSNKKYGLFENSLPHNISNYYKRINSFWNKEADIFFKKNKADIFFKSRYIGLATDYISFTDKQDLKKLPKEFFEYYKKVVIFNSSDYEYEYIGNEYSSKFYKSQNDGIKQIVNSLKDDINIGIFLREHPGQKNKNNFQRNSLKQIKAKNFHLLSAESDISSYKLLLNADIVITFNSTMGIEATYWGIPSILCSNAIYELLNIVYIPTSHEEVIKLIKSDLKPIVNNDVYKYGYYHSTFGIDFEYYQPNDYRSGLFMGINLYTENKILNIRNLKFFIKTKFYLIYKFYKYLKQ